MLREELKATAEELLRLIPEPKGEVVMFSRWIYWFLALCLSVVVQVVAILAWLFLLKSTGLTFSGDPANFILWGFVPPAALTLCMALCWAARFYRASSGALLDMVYYLTKDPKQAQGRIGFYPFSAGIIFKARRIRRLVNRAARMRRRYDEDDPRYIEANREAGDAVKSFWRIMDVLRETGVVLMNHRFKKLTQADPKPSWRDVLKFNF